MLKPELLKRKKELETLCTNLEDWLKKAPAGEIWVSSRKSGGKRIYRFFTGRKELFPAKEKPRIKNLLTKEYYRDLLVAAREDIKQLSRLIKTENQIVEAYNKMHIARKLFVKPFQEPVEDIIRKFEKEPFIPSDYQIENPKPTLKGENVRSFAEAKIADALFLAKIPYRYERPFTLFNNHSVRPDFTIIHPMTGELYIWEHFGRIDRQSYKSNTVEKIKNYAKSGMILGKNLIATFEDDELKITDGEIQQLIEVYFL